VKTKSNAGIRDLFSSVASKVTEGLKDKSNKAKSKSSFQDDDDDEELPSRPAWTSSQDEEHLQNIAEFLKDDADPEADAGESDKSKQ